MKSRNAIFIHIPKTAGVAISKTLSPYLKPYDLQLGGTRFAEKLNEVYADYSALTKHSKAFEVARILGQEFFEMEIFAVIRHPIDRIVSAFRYLKDKSITDAYWGQEMWPDIREMSHISEFVKSKHFWWINPFKPYIELDGIVYVNNILRYENLQEDFNLMCDKLKIQRIQLKKDNESRYGNHNEIRYDLHNDKECLDIVYSKFNMDFEYYD